MNVLLAPLLGLGMLVGGGTDGARGDADLAKGRQQTDAWTGLTVGEVLAEDQVQRVILLKAVTSAMAGLDLANLRRLLRDAAPLRFTAGEPGWPWRSPDRDATWEAVLIAHDGRVFALVVGGARAGLRDQDGRGGCFPRPPRLPD